MDADAALAAELRRLRLTVPAVHGAVLAGLDGLLIAGVTARVDPHHIAALSATALGVCRGFSTALGDDGPRECVIRLADDWVASYPAGGHAVLTLLASAEVEAARMHAEGHGIAGRLGPIWDMLRVRFNSIPWPVSTDQGCMPLAVRTPMATLSAADRRADRHRGWPAHWR